MAIYYHGTIVKNINELKPFQGKYSNLNYPCVYLSAKKAMAAIYIWNKPFMWMSYDIKDDGIPIITESFSNHLYEFYNGVSGCIYTCEGNFITDFAVGIKFAAVSKDPIKVKEYENVNNAYEKLLEYENKKELKIIRFNELKKENIEGRNRTILKTIKHYNLLDEKHPMAPFIKEKFPEVWEEAKKQNRVVQ
ncbi:hypothetical protein AGMMS50255_5630 [Spirochaetia bacterium]|nr:hypothetical protein AGMMS50255_5630 [Spirochaetia bacterium]